MTKKKKPIPPPEPPVEAEAPPAIDPKAAILLEVARLRAHHHIKDAIRILVDDTYNIPFSERDRYTVIIGALSTLKRHLEELAPEEPKP